MDTQGIGVVREKPILGASMFGVLCVLFLVLVGGGQTSLASGVALLASGLTLLIWPPKRGLGPGLRYSFLAFFICMSLAFLPQFYWPNADWRTTAIETYGIDLPSILTIQPRISLEALILLVGGYAWFVALANSPLNGGGVRRTLLIFSLITVALAGYSVYANLHGFNHAIGADSAIFSFLFDRIQAANFFSLAGVVSFGFALEGLRHRHSLDIVGFIASGLCLSALILIQAPAALLFYFIGVLLNLIIQFRKLSLGVYIKIGIPLLLLLLFGSVMFSTGRFQADIVTSIAPSTNILTAFHVDVFRDTWAMILESPIAGVGLGNFAEIFPQYRDASLSPESVVHPESDFLWLLAEGGFVSLICLAVILFFFARICFSSRGGRISNYRLILAVALLTFALHSLVAVSAHRLGSVYLLLFLAALMVPRSRQQFSSMRPIWWRTFGLMLSLMGVLWMGAHAFGWRLHSSIIVDQYVEELDDYVQNKDFIHATQLVEEQLKERPLNWQLYHQFAHIEMEHIGDRKLADEIFRSARFIQPNLGTVCLEEGFIWLPYDLSRAVAAWRESLSRESDNHMEDFKKMLDASLKSPLLLDRLSSLSELEPEYRIHFLKQLKSISFEKELRRELERDPDLLNYTKQQQSELLKHWINHADLATAEVFIIKHEADLPKVWRLWAEIHKSQARFKEAVEIVRKAITIPMIPEGEFEESQLPRIERSFAVAPNDLSKGISLLQYYIEQGAWEKALIVTDKIVEFEDAPSYALYWKAEMLYLLEDYIQSWYVFDLYMDR